jgi:glycosyltransferase involved in cell wall biosynthesis
VHVLELTDFYRPVIGGLERHVETLSRELVRLGHTVTVVTLQTNDEPAEETLDGVRVLRIRGWSRILASFHADAARPFHPTVPDPGAIGALRRIVQAENPAVVHSHSWLQYSYFPLHRYRRGPGHVVTLHDYGLACAKKTLQRVSRSRAGPDGGFSAAAGEQHTGVACSGPALAKCLFCVPEQYGIPKGTAIATGLRVSRALNQRADSYIAISKAVADGSRSALPSRFEIVVLPTMVPNQLSILAEATPRPAFLPPEDGYLMFVGALGRHKGLDVLLEAKRRMRNRLRLVLIGTQQTDTPLIDDPQITVARDVPSAQVMASWLRASVAVVPSVWPEPMGQVAIEAMVVGRPVVASDVGGLRDVVDHGVSGLLVPPADPSALAAALDRLVDDPQRRQRMGAAGRLKARQFEVAAVAPRVIEVFDETLAQRARRQ